MATDLADAGSAGGRAAVGDATRFRILLVIAVLANLFNILDRAVLNILAEPIRRDLGLSDTQLGILTGFAFALFYSLAGLPIARYVDRPRTNRPTVIAACLALWSAMTMACGLAANFGQLMVARMLVAVGESGGGPPILTLINHYVAPANRARAFAIYGLGIPLGALVGLMVGGWLFDLVGWRWTFVLVSAPGLLLAVLIKLGLYEPRVDAVQPTRGSEIAHPSLVDNFRVIGRSRALLYVCIAASIGGLYVTAIPSWTGVYLIRVLALSPTKAGLILGLTMAVGAIGTYFGGAIADRLSRRESGRALLVPCGGLLIGIPAAIAAFVSHDWRIFAALYWVPVIGAMAYLGPFFSVVQLLVSEKYRATTIVIILMFFNLVGVGLGSLLIGAGSDLLRPRFGIDGLRWALVAASAFAVVPALFYWRAGTLMSRIVDRQQ